VSKLTNRNLSTHPGATDASMAPQVPNLRVSGRVRGQKPDDGHAAVDDCAGLSDDEVDHRVALRKLRRDRAASPCPSQ
jgi:hypothetical protein